MLDPTERATPRPLRVRGGRRVRVAEGGGRAAVRAEGGGGAAVRAEGGEVTGRAQQAGPADLVDVVERVAELGHGFHVAGSAAPHVVNLYMIIFGLTPYPGVYKGL